MSKANRWRPRVEALEGRDPPAHLSLSAPATFALVARHARHLTLKGQVSGVWSVAPGVPDVGADQSLTGSGSVRPLGEVGASADLRLPGFVAVGQAQGRLTLATRQGSITLSLLGPQERGFGGAPATLTYTITGGTGKYAGASGGGKVALQEKPASNPCSRGAVVCPYLGTAPQFTLTF